MKKVLVGLLAACMVLGLLACAGGSEVATTGNAEEEPVAFKAGFGMQDITPKESVPMASYGDLRFSDGWYSRLEARAVALQDESGGMLVFIVGDLSWCPKTLGSTIKSDLSAELGIPQANIILSGTHTHGSVDTGKKDYPAVTAFNKQYIDGMEEAARLAVADLKPAEVYVGSVMTEGMNFVRRYIMDDGSLIGDNAYGTGTEIVRHETDADGEVQLMRFVREGGRDILISNFQAHPHLEGKTSSLSAQTVGAIRDAVEKNLDAYSLHWNGAAGNLNTTSRISAENKYSETDRVRYGEDMCKYIESVYGDLTKVETGPVKVTETTYEGKINHTMDDFVQQAKEIDAYMKKTNDAGQTARFAWTFGVGINSVYHARRIIGNSRESDTKSMPLVAWSFGDVGGIAFPFEMFDQTAMYIKETSPFERTFILGYSYPAGFGYIPTEEAYRNGGYESDNSFFVPGTAEQIADLMLTMLNRLHE